MSDTGKSERAAFNALIRDIAAMLTLGASGTTLALTGHDQVAGTVFGALAMYLVPSSANVPRAALAMVGAIGGTLIGAAVGGV